jgi:hypothetical protein
VRNDADLQGLTPSGIKQLMIDWVTKQNGEIIQRNEEREFWSDQRDFWYFVLIPVVGL